jgi:hypothetical protein
MPLIACRWLHAAAVQVSLVLLKQQHSGLAQKMHSINTNFTVDTCHVQWSTNCLIVLKFCSHDVTKDPSASEHPEQPSSNSQSEVQLQHKTYNKETISTGNTDMHFLLLLSALVNW